MKEQIRFLEEIASNGHVALNVMQYDGWLLRFSDGYTGRGNSVSALYPSGKSLAEKTAYCEACYARQNLPALFKITDCDTELYEFLRARGYETVKPTDVMTADLQGISPPADRAECVFDAEPREWLPAYFLFEGLTDPSRQEVFRRMLSRVLVETIYCTLLWNGRPAACASAAMEQGYMLLQNVVVDPLLRGKGLGEKLCRSILARGREQGARHAYLQVVQDNEAAANLYKKLGFEKVYSYRYMKQPDSAKGSRKEEY